MSRERAPQRAKINAKPVVNKICMAKTKGKVSHIKVNGSPVTKTITSNTTRETKYC
jgi:hypothetical protein